MTKRTHKFKATMAWIAVATMGLVSLAGILTIGVFTLPLAVAAAVLLLTRPDRTRAIAIMLCALAVGPMLTAWFNREGPGTVCRDYPPDGVACADYLNPWPWFVGALVSLTLASALFLYATRRGTAARAGGG